MSLFSAQMSDNELCDWDLSSRLEAIRRHTDAWNNLRFPIRKQIPMAHDLVIDKGQDWDLVGGVLVQTRPPHGGISCVQMPCSVKDIPECRWITSIEFRIEHFAIDVAQDLLVAIELHQG